MDGRAVSKNGRVVTCALEDDGCTGYGGKPGTYCGCVEGSILFILDNEQVSNRWERFAQELERVFEAGMVAGLEAARNE